MTICIAAICVSEGGSMIVGASDRMISTIDIEAEPLMSKVIQYHPNGRFVSLVADNTSSHAAIYNAVRPALNAFADPTAQQVADVWTAQYGEYRRQQAERRLLAPLGLNSYTLLRSSLPVDRVDKLVEEMREYRAQAQSIITGVDADGIAHVFVVGDPDGRVVCADFDGFAAIGIGEWHVESEFLLAGYTNKWQFPQAMLLVYSAKRRAEAAPGVGKATDLFIITQAGEFVWVGEEHLTKLARIYRESERKQKRASDKALDEIKNYVEDIFAKAGQQEGSDPTQEGSDNPK